MTRHAPTDEALKSWGSSAGGPEEARLSVTVGLPVYNGAAGVRASVASVLHQTWRGEIRVLIVDDGSTDDTPKILAELAERYPNVTVIRHPVNRGRAAARNTILRHADSEYLAWIDSDDVWYPEKLEKQFDALRARRDDRGVLCTCPYTLITEDGSVLHKRPKVRGDQIRSCLESRLYPFLWSLLGRTETFRDVGEFDERLLRRQDFEFFLRFLLNGGLVVSTDPDIPLCEYRRTDVGRSGWQIAAANRVIWKRYRRVFARYGWGYAYRRQAAQHALCARFFRANGERLPCALFEARRRAALAIGLALTIGSVAGAKAWLRDKAKRFAAKKGEVSASARKRVARFVRLGEGPLTLDVSELDAQRANPGFAAVIDLLGEEADAALERGPYSVVDKGRATVGTLHDYWSPSPYWWPNPETLNGRPYVHDPDRRVPGTAGYEPGSERFDRARLQRLCDDALVLALAHRVFGKAEYGLHALALLHRWFIDPATRMNPHLKYADVMLGHHLDQGMGSGIVEAQALWYLLEAVRLLAAEAALERPRLESLRSWFTDYLHWLLNSWQGRWARSQKGFHGAYYELQVAAAASFVGNEDALAECVARAERKIRQEYGPLVSARRRNAIAESREATGHVLLAWSNLHYLTRACGVGLWDLASVRPAIEAACEYVLLDSTRRETRGEEERAALLPLAAAYEDCFGGAIDLAALARDHGVLDGETLSFHAVRPFWVLGIRCRPDFLAVMQRLYVRGAAHDRYLSADLATG